MSHLLAVASGLDSMVVGEGQMLGQVRWRSSSPRSRHGRQGAGELGQLALHTGKRVHQTRPGSAGPASAC